MQWNRGQRGNSFGFGDPFGGFGGHRRLLSSFFGGRDLFDDSFFTCPFGGMFESGFFDSGENHFMGMHPQMFLEHQPPEPKKSRGPIIEELNSDDEKEETEQKKGNPRKHNRSGTEPRVEFPDETAGEKKCKRLQNRVDCNSFNGVHMPHDAHSFTFQSSSITYGGPNGDYYASSKSRRMGSDGVTIDESKEADTSTGLATHRVSRGLHNKGHTVVRKLNSDGKVDVVQTLHNLNKHDLPAFEETWRGNTRDCFPGWIGSVNGNGSMGPDSGSQNLHSSKMCLALPSVPKVHEHAESLLPRQSGKAKGPKCKSRFAK